MKEFALNAAERAQVKGATNTEGLASLIDGLEQKTEKHEALRKKISSFRKGRLILSVIDFLSKRMPSMSYTSHYNRMAGEISLNKLSEDKSNEMLSVADEIFLDFLEYAGTNIEELCDSSKFEDLKAQCEGASNDIGAAIFSAFLSNGGGTGTS